MKRFWSRVVAGIALALVVASAAPACATNDESIFVKSVLAPATNRQNGRCVYTADPQQPGLFEGLLDIGLRSNYTAVLLVGNQMIVRGDPNRPRAESSRVHINGAVVRVTDPDGNVLGGCPNDCEFTSAAAGAVADPQTANQPGYIPISVTALDIGAAQALVGGLPPKSGQTRLVLANIKVFGKTLGGTDIESGEMQFPIRVCNGCLIKFDANDPAQQPVPNCLGQAAGSGGGGTQTGPCFSGQDEAVSCSTCYGGGPGTPGYRDICDPAK